MDVHFLSKNLQSVSVPTNQANLVSPRSNSNLSLSSSSVSPLVGCGGRVLACCLRKERRTISLAMKAGSERIPMARLVCEGGEVGEEEEERRREVARRRISWRRCLVEGEVRDEEEKWVRGQGGD